MNRSVSLKSAICAAALAACASAYGVELRYVDLEKHLSEKNGHVASAHLHADAAEAETGHLFRSYLPKITGSAGYEAFKTGFYAYDAQPFGVLEASLNLFQGGRDYVEHRLQSERRDLSSSEMRQKLRDELLKARRDFWALRFADEVLVSLRESLAQNDKYFQAASRRVSAGMGAETDRYEFEINRTELEQDIALTSLQRQNSERRLASTLGLDEAVTLELIEEPHQHDDANVPANLSRADQLEFEQAQINGNIAELQRNLGRLWWAPSLDVYASHGLYTFREKEYFLRDERFETVLGVKLTISLFDGWSGPSRSAAENLRAQAYREGARQTFREAHTDFENARAQLKLTHDLVHGTEKNLEQAQKYLRGTLSEYQRGVKNSPDVLSASQRILNFRRRLAELKRDYQIAKAELLATVNK